MASNLCQALLNGHDHNLQHVVPVGRSALGGPVPAAVHYITTGAGSDTRDDVDRDASTDGSLKFAYGATPGFVVLRATLDVLRITHHAAPGLLHTEEIWRK